MNDPRFDRDYLYRRNNLRDGWWLIPACIFSGALWSAVMAAILMWGRV